VITKIKLKGKRKKVDVRRGGKKKGGKSVKGSCLC
jgi:hypothetical protein